MVLRSIINNCLTKLFYGATLTSFLYTSLMKQKDLLCEKIFTSRRMLSPHYSYSPCHRFAYLYPIKSPTQVRLYAEMCMGAGVGLVSAVTVLA